MDAKKLKAMVKRPAPPSKISTDASDPWSIKAGLSEDTISEDMLDDFLKSRGVDPKYVSMQTKVSHAKSGEFKKWARDRKSLGEDRTVEPSHTQKKSKDLSSSTKSQEVIKTPRGPGVKEEVEQIDEISKELATGYMYSAMNDRNKTDKKISDASKKQGDEFSKRRHSTIGKLLVKSMKRTTGIQRALDRVKEDVEQIDELSIDTLTSYHQKAAKTIFDKPRKGIARAVAKRREKEGKKDGGGAEKYYASKKPGQYVGDSVEIDAELIEAKLSAAAKLQRAFQSEKGKIERERRLGQDLMHPKGSQSSEMTPSTPMKKEDVGDPKSATQSPSDGANGGNQISERQRQMSKSARMIKALYKKKGVVKEDMYDHEKEDKSVATYGKKPKLETGDKDDSKGENKPQAAAVLSGGKTLTGTERDTVELDPMMRNRPNQPDVTKKEDKDKKDGKKDDKKKDK
jgi:hypothetical protein